NDGCPSGPVIFVRLLAKARRTRACGPCRRLSAWETWTERENRSVLLHLASGTSQPPPHDAPRASSRPGSGEPVWKHHGGARSRVSTASRIANGTDLESRETRNQRRHAGLQRHALFAPGGGEHAAPAGRGGGGHGRGRRLHRRQRPVAAARGPPGPAPSRRRGTAPGHRRGAERGPGGREPPRGGPDGR